MLATLALKLVASSFEKKPHKLPVPSELHSNKLYIGITKSKASVSSIVFPSIFVIHLVTSVQVLNATGVGLLCAVATISPLTKKCKNHCNQKDYKGPAS